MDLTTLSRQQLHDYRLDLTHALVFPGGEGIYSEEDRALYLGKIDEIKTILGPD